MAGRTRKGQFAGIGLGYGTTLLDYTGAAAPLIAKMGSSEALRQEYMRMRAVVQKRIKRLSANEETNNAFYRLFSDKRTLPTQKGMTDTEIARRMAQMARAIAGDVPSTVGEIRQARKARMKQERAEILARAIGKEERKRGRPLTPKEARAVERSAFKSLPDLIQQALKDPEKYKQYQKMKSAMFEAIKQELGAHPEAGTNPVPVYEEYVRDLTREKVPGTTEEAAADAVSHYMESHQDETEESEARLEDLEDNGSGEQLSLFDFFDLAMTFE